MVEVRNIEKHEEPPDADHALIDKAGEKFVVSGSAVGKKDDGAVSTELLVIVLMRISAGPSPQRGTGPRRPCCRGLKPRKHFALRCFA